MDRQRIIDTIRKWVEDGHVPSSKYAHDRNRRVWQYARDLFGDWYAAVEAAGIDPAPIVAKQKAINARNRQNGRTPDAWRKAAATRTGRKRSERERSAISRGWHQSDAAKEHLEDIRDAGPKDDAFKLATSLGQRQHSVSDETRRKIGDAARGREKSAETIAKSRKRLTYDAAEEIRRLYDTHEFTQPQLAQMYGISKSHVHLIVTHKVWRHPR
ncbi:hypothetical protein [Alicyclobacillus sp. ALC3]|uniref:hypothetical protein n=1 Tax=Alicyclobacillus sp. ALC3 TaxID=2796143 RepID=UPI0023790638|nr:hypothetical protein [Alicyclobacillus sp. ALC3]WDL99763.1 hypothetical protein JC200_23610 [Alicyclobacillus sp. ALC3]